MSDHTDGVLAGSMITIISVIVFGLACGMAYRDGKRAVQQEAVERGYGETTEDSGRKVFRWVKP